MPSLKVPSPCDHGGNAWIHSPPGRTIAAVTQDPARIVEFRTGASGLNGLPWFAWVVVLGLGVALPAAESDGVMRWIGWAIFALLPIGLVVQFVAARGARAEAIIRAPDERLRAVDAEHRAVRQRMPERQHDLQERMNTTFGSWGRRPAAAAEGAEPSR